MANHVRIPIPFWKIVDHSDVAYLIIDWFNAGQIKKYVKLAHAAPTKSFYRFVTKNINAAMDGKSVAPTIEGAIMNLIDEKMSNGKMTMRAGDYIALQRQFRVEQRSKKKMTK